MTLNSHCRSFYFFQMFYAILKCVGSYVGSNDNPYSYDALGSILPFVARVAVLHSVFCSFCDFSELVDEFALSKKCSVSVEKKRKCRTINFFFFLVQLLISVKPSWIDPMVTLLSINMASKRQLLQHVGHMC